MNTIFALSSLTSFVLLAPTALADVELSINGFVEPGDSPASPGDNITIEYTVYNGGSSEAEDVPVGFYFSTDTVFDADDIFIEAEDVSLDEFESEDESEQIGLPGSLPNGSHYILAFVDYPKVFSEGNEGNNIDAMPIEIINGTPGAQAVGFEGEVVATGGGFALAASPLTLSDPSGLLPAVAGANARITGDWLPGSTSVTVASASPTSAMLTVPAAPALGTTASFQVAGPAGEVALLAFSAQAAFTPYEGASDAVFLGPFLFQATQALPDTGFATYDYAIPDAPALSGFQVFAQAAVSQPAGGWDVGNSWTATL